jgi:hypothetical protein
MNALAKSYNDIIIMPYIYCLKHLVLKIVTTGYESGFLEHLFIHCICLYFMLKIGNLFVFPMSVYFVTQDGTFV